MTTLREEIKSGVEKLKKNEDLLALTTDDVIDIALQSFEKRIDNLVSRAALTLEPLTNSEWNAAIYKVKEILK